MPYGEEAFIGVGNRAVGHGYTYGDSTRQKFTGYERDEESGLDFAQARMHNYNHGRFTLPDRLQASATAIRPQSWNRYSYSYNNPLRFTDPSGMIAGDFYDEDGKKIGTDGIDDGKIYLVTDKDDRKQIRKDKGKPYSATVNSALELPNFQVRQEIGVDAVARSNSPTTDDTEGGFHEEGGTVWNGVDGQLAIPAKSRAAVDGLTADKASIQNFDPADPKLTEQINPDSPDLLTSYHIHPSGVARQKKELSASNETVIGGSEVVSRDFVQHPCDKDIRTFGQGPAPKLGYRIVVGARNKTVYFCKGSGNRSSCNCVGKMPLHKFISIR